MKKKILIFSLILVCLLSVIVLASCGGGDNRPSYTVTFDPAGGEFDGDLTITVKEGDKIPKPDDPYIEGQRFTGWYSGKKSNTIWKFNEYVVTEDITLTAWYTGGSACSHEVTIVDEEASYPATCASIGLDVRICVSCKAALRTTLPKTGHNEQFEHVDVTCAINGYDRKYCTNEGCTYEVISNEVAATGLHDWGKNFVTLVEATKYVGGQEAKTCQVCGKYQVFYIPAFAELDGDLDDMEIGDYRYTGGSYVNAPFVDIAKFAGVQSSSYYTVCYAKNAIDGATGTFWCADTLANGANPSGDSLVLVFSEDYTIGMVKLLVPYYSSWKLGDDCYVSYNVEALINGKWEFISEISDKTAVPSGINGSVSLEFESPITTSAIRLTVTHATRFTPAMIYEIEVMADVNDIQRVTTDLLNVSSLSSSGKYNSWATGAEAIIDGSLYKAWQTNIRDLGTSITECYASLTFPDAKLVTAVQIAIAANASKQFSIYYLDENGNWTLATTYTITKGSNVAISGDSNGDGVADGVEITLDNGSKLYQFTCEINKFTEGVKLVIDKDGDPWSSFVYEFTPYSVVQQATPESFNKYAGCIHNAYKEIEKIAPTCSQSGYSLVECYGCGLQLKTDAVDALVHTFGDWIITTEATNDTNGIKTATCSICYATKTTSYKKDYKDATITTYLHDAPAAWSISLDDGNYTETYDWLIPKLKKYNWKATIALAICFSDTLADKWQNEYFASGVLDLASHSYNHAGIYSGKVSEPSMIEDVFNAHYWFMSKYPGQRILGFATPNGTTSEGTSDFVLGLMSTCRNGGGTSNFWVIPSELSSRRDWGYINSYISKADQTEGPYVFVSNDGKIAGHYKKTTKLPVIDEATGEQMVDEDGNLVWETLSTPQYEFVQSGSYTSNGDWRDDDSGTHWLIKTPNDYYHLVAKSDINANTNYVYDKTANTLVNVGRLEGTYVYKKTVENGKMTDSEYYWVELGSYDLNSDGTFTFRADNNGAYKLNHPELGSYEKGINQILNAGGWTVECLHCILPDHSSTNQIWSSYASTNSKHTYLEQTGIWVGSWTEVTQYLREAANATLTTVEHNDSRIVLTLTDTLDDTMFNFPLTIKVDIDDSWALSGIVATQNGSEVYSFIKDGFAFVDAIPDAGEIVIVPDVKCTDGTASHTFGDWETTKEATCTEDGERTKTCETCGHVAKEVITSCHTYTDKVVEGSTVTATCSKCNLTVSTSLVNVTAQSTLNSNLTLLDGEINKRQDISNLLDGNHSTIISSTNKTLSIGLDMTNDDSPFIDFINVYGQGTDTFSISVLYEGDTEYTELGTGTLKDGETFEVHRKVTKIIITQLSFEDRASSLREITFTNIPI